MEPVRSGIAQIGSGSGWIITSMVNLLKIGLIIIPFYELVIRCFPSAFVIGTDTRGPKLALSLMIALAVGLWCLFQGKLKTFQNKGMLAFVAYAFLSMQLAPNVPLFINDQDSSMFWMWKQMVIILIYAFLIISVASIDFRKEDIGKISNIMAYCGAIMAIYVFIQWAGLDQFFVAKTQQTITSVENYKLVGVLGQPTVVSSFLAIILPIALCSRKTICTIIIAAALFLINSKVALVSGYCGVLACSIFTRKSYATTILLLLAVLFVLSAFVFRSDWTDSGRIEQWRHILNYWKTPLSINGAKGMHTIAGFGPGSFEYFYPISRSSNFFHPHNEYIYILFNFGIAGLGIILYSIFIMAKKFFISCLESVHIDNSRFGFMSSFIVALALSGGTFILGLGAHSFYMAIIVGLLHNNQYLQGGGLDA